MAAPLQVPLNFLHPSDPDCVGWIKIQLGLRQRPVALRQWVTPGQKDGCLYSLYRQRKSWERLSDLPSATEISSGSNRDGDLPTPSMTRP